MYALASFFPTLKSACFIGSCIEDEAVLKFATTTGATVVLHDFSVPALSADYDPYLYIGIYIYIYICHNVNVCAPIHVYNIYMQVAVSSLHIVSQ